MGFIGLHNHTERGSNVRLRDSTNRVADLIDYTHKIGHKGVAITDHECLSAHLQAINYYQLKKKEPGWENYKLLLGNEIYLCTEEVNKDNPDRLKFPHFILIALDAEGHKQLRELSTQSWLYNSFFRVMMRVPTYYNDLFEKIINNPGHVVASSACIGGALPSRLLEYRDLENTSQYEQIWDSCIDWINTMNEVFGQGYFFLELQPSDNEEQIYVNSKLINLSKITNTPYIITTDAHYLTKEDSNVHRAFLNAQEGEREVDSFYATTYVMTEEEIHSYMDKYLGYDVVQKGIDNTILIYDMAEDYDLKRDLEIPYVPLNTEEPSKELYEEYKTKLKYLDYFYNSEYDCDRHFARELLNAFNNDEQYRNKETYEAVDVCLNSIIQSSEKMNTQWSAYLLDVSDLVKLAWEAGAIVGAGRGSGVGFIVNNMLGITQINPLREDVRTFHWRFLNPERASVLDIDVDIPKSKRGVVVQKLRDTYGEDRISKVQTVSTEGSRSALLSACRALNIDNDMASYMTSFIVADRGITRSLKQTYYGDIENSIKPDKEFVSIMNDYPEVWEIAQKIEGLTVGVGSHAGGIVLVDKPFTETAALMRTNSGDVITQYNLHELEEMSLIKFDLLSIALDKMQTALELMIEDKVIEWQGTLKDTYDKYLGIYTLERNNKEMWKLLWEHKVPSFFQFETLQGVKCVDSCKPDSVASLAALNSVMRLMAQEEGAEQPIDKYKRFKNDITQWYKEMDEYGLTLEEQELLKTILNDSCGICESQEKFMQLVQLEECGGFSLTWADRLRKSIAKKSPKDYEKLTKEFFEITKEKGCSKNLCNYVWNVLIATSRGYGFNSSHCLAYSLIGVQELNLCYKYNPVYWYTANLIVDSGSIDEEGENKSTDYGKIASAIGNIKSMNVEVTLPLINETDFGFNPDAKNNRIISGIKNLNGIGDEVARTLLLNRPYTSMEDFYTRMILPQGDNSSLIKTSQMVKLIKAGCFTKLDNPDRTKTMEYFLKTYVMSPASKLTMSQYNKIKEFDEKYHIIPDSINLAIRHKNFKDYVLSDCFLKHIYIDPTKKAIPKCGYHDRFYQLDNIAMQFFTIYYSEDSIVEIIGNNYVISEKKFKKENEKYVEELKKWLANEKTVKIYNDCQFKELWEKHAEGNVSTWEMDSLCAYVSTPHELAHINTEKYGIKSFNNLPEEPVAYDYYTRTINQTINGVTERVQKQFPKYQISRLAGTVLDSDNNKHLVTLLCHDGIVVKCKFNKGQFVNYNRVISHIDENGKKVTDEGSWFKRGNLVLLHGYRQEAQFRCYNYSDTVYKHTCNLITSIDENGNIEIATERMRLDE